MSDSFTFSPDSMPLDTLVDYIVNNCRETLEVATTSRISGEMYDSLLQTLESRAGFCVYSVIPRQSSLAVTRDL